MRRFALVSLLVLLAGCGGGDDTGFAVYDFERDLDPAPQMGEIRCDPAVPCEAMAGASRFNARRDPAVTNDGLSGARVARDPTTGAASVLVSLTKQGQQSFHELTRAVSRRGGRIGHAEHVAIAVDGVLVSVAAIDPVAYPDGLSAESGIQITALSPERARAIADELDD